MGREREIAAVVRGLERIAAEDSVALGRWGLFAKAIVVKYFPADRDEFVSLVERARREPGAGGRDELLAWFATRLP